jgi:hypothetical protein
VVFSLAVARVGLISAILLPFSAYELAQACWRAADMFCAAWWSRGRRPKVSMATSMGLGIGSCTLEVTPYADPILSLCLF